MSPAAEPPAPSRRRRTIRVTKAPLPVLWVDSSVEMKLAKIQRGEALPAEERERLNQVRVLIEEKIAAGRLACPVGDQDEEVQVGRRLVPETRELALFGTPRPAFKLRHEIQFVQLVRAIEAFVGDRDEIACEWSDGLVSRAAADRPKLLVPILQRRVDATPEDIAHVRATRERHAQRLEELRQRNRERRRTFDEQVAAEDDIITNLLAAHHGPRHPPPGSLPEQEDVKPLGLLERLHFAWIRVVGRPPLPEESAGFLRSGFFRSMPEHYISTRLYADLLTSDRQIRDGDGMDVEQLAAVIPYSTIVITDGDMRDRLERLSIGSTFQTSIHSARKRDADALLDVLRGL